MWKRLNRPSERVADGQNTSTSHGHVEEKTRPITPVRSAEARFSTVSSVYSQPSPEMRQHAPTLHIPRSSSVYPDDVSPPDSPRTIDGEPSHKSTSPNISPITDGGSVFRGNSQKKPYMSNIPLPKGPSAKGSTAAYVSGWREKIGRDQSDAAESKMTKWDDYSGEPNARGKPPQTVPGATPFDLQGTDPDKLKDAAKVVSVRQQRQNLWASKLKKVGRKDPATILEAREEWKGASGRAAIVMPVAEKPLPPGKKAIFPLPQERKGLTQGPTARSTSGPSPTPEAEADPMPGPRKESLPINKPLPATARITTVAPSPPEGHSRNSPSPRDTPRSYSPASPDPVLPINTPLDVDRRSPLGRNPARNAIIDDPRGITPILSAGPNATALESVRVAPAALPPTMPVADNFISQESQDSQLRTAVRNMQLQNEPASRFSVTTYAPTIPDSPPDTPRRSFEEARSMPSPPQSILNRKRPVPVSGVPVGRGPSRKPTPSEVEIGFGNGKSLPNAPTDAQAVDRVAVIEAKLAALHRRQGNLQTVIHELTHVVQPSSIAYDIASRQEIKKTVEGLNTESAAVAKEIYETGMKLHRAWKKRDEQSMFEPTGLWVRRVTE